MLQRKIFGIRRDDWSFMWDCIQGFFTLWVCVHFLGFENSVMITVILILFQLKRIRPKDESVFTYEQKKELTDIIRNEVKNPPKEKII